jgi:hypothetical protein
MLSLSLVKLKFGEQDCKCSAVLVLCIQISQQRGGLAQNNEAISKRQRVWT